jgi:hypothetical protein
LGSSKAMIVSVSDVFDGKVRRELKPQSTFTPLGYCGDPASFELEQSVPEFFQADVEMDALKIAAVLKNGSNERPVLR